MIKVNKIIVILLTAIALAVCSVCPVYALEGYDNWKSIGEYNNDAEMPHYFHIFEDCGVLARGVANSNGYLLIDGDFNKYDDGASGVRLTIEVRDADTHETLLTITADNTDISAPTRFRDLVPVHKNQKIELFFDASSIDNPPGFYRWAAVEYTVIIT